MVCFLLIYTILYTIYIYSIYLCIYVKVSWFLVFFCQRMVTVNVLLFFFMICRIIGRTKICSLIYNKIFALRLLSAQMFVPYSFSQFLQLLLGTLKMYAKYLFRKMAVKTRLLDFVDVSTIIISGRRNIRIRGSQERSWIRIWHRSKFQTRIFFLTDPGSLFSNGLGMIRSKYEDSKGHRKNSESQMLYVQEVVTLKKKKYLIYLHSKMRFTPFINYYDTLG